MSETEKTTLERILSAAMREFLEKGYQSASLRNIVKTAGVTTGAFYGYYKSKEELFEALVGEQYDYFMDCFRNAQYDFAALPPEEQPDTELGRPCATEWQEAYFPTKAAWEPWRSSTGRPGTHRGKSRGCGPCSKCFLIPLYCVR